jgi:hypothetical protein
VLGQAQANLDGLLVLLIQFPIENPNKTEFEAAKTRKRQTKATKTRKRQTKATTDLEAALAGFEEIFSLLGPSGPKSEKREWLRMNRKMIAGLLTWCRRAQRRHAGSRSRALALLKQAIQRGCLLQGLTIDCTSDGEAFKFKLSVLVGCLRMYFVEGSKLFGCPFKLG